MAEEMEIYFLLTKACYIIERNSNYFLVSLEGGEKDLFGW